MSIRDQLKEASTQANYIELWKSTKDLGSAYILQKLGRLYDLGSIGWRSLE